MKTTFDAKMTCVLSSDGRFSISVEDRASGCHVLEVRMTPADFAMMLAARACQNGKGKFFPGAMEVIGKRKETLTIELPTRAEWSARLNKPRRGSPEHQAVREELEAALLAAAPQGEGWKLWDDGHTVQQPAENWRGVLCRWVAEDALPTLIPCPDCGTQPLPGADIHPNGIGDEFVRCPGCGKESSQVRCESKQHAAERWNAGIYKGHDFED